MRASLPRLSLLLRRPAYFAALNTFQECSCQFALAGVALAVHGAKVEELIAECVALLLLRKYALQRDGQFAQANGFGPWLFVFVADGFTEEALASAGTLIETGHQLIAEGTGKRLKIAGL
jgi:hypothetical protein